MKRTLPLSIEGLLQLPQVRRTERVGRTLYVAAVFVAAVQDARAGDDEARQWVDVAGVAVASLLIPATVDPAFVVKRLMTGAR